ncbi:MAG: hypothetical protein K6D90_10120 [Lachnospiraceae bacterium]|nr:hypothetical protein [Lachnospiraceae bacterium]
MKRDPFSRKRTGACMGSMTVEITLLMPFLIGVFLFIFFTLYYVHDIAALQKGCSTALIRGSLTRDRKEAQSEMETALEEIRLLGKWNIQKTAVVEKDKVKVSVSGTMEVRQGLFKKLLDKDYAYHTEQSAERIDETAYILKRSR